MDGSKGPSAQSAEDFSKYISNNVSIPVTMWDERLSSQGAFNLSSNLDINISKKVKKKNAIIRIFLFIILLIFLWVLTQTTFFRFRKIFFFLDEIYEQ